MGGPLYLAGFDARLPFLPSTLLDHKKIKLRSVQWRAYPDEQGNLLAQKIFAQNRNSFKCLETRFQQGVCSHVVRAICSATIKESPISAAQTIDKRRQVFYPCR
jgi:hypothetical protein